MGLGKCYRRATRFCFGKGIVEVLGMSLPMPSCVWPPNKAHLAALPALPDLAPAVVSLQ